MSKVKRTAAGLRDALFDELDKLRSGDGDPIEANAVANLAKQIINVTKSELEFQAKLNKDNSLCDDFMLGELRLGSSSAEKQQ